jgi:cytoskeletal protein CcmA (bactofilin family)
VAVLTLGGAGVASAHGFYSGDNITIGGERTIDNTVFAAGRNIHIGSEVNGDVFVAGQTINISGPVRGDVIAAGQTITVSGNVSGDVRLAGQTISLSSAVGGNATVAGQSFTLDSKGSIGGDATIGATDTSLNGNVRRDVSIGGDNAVVSGAVGRNITTHANHLRLGPGARVAGNIEHTSSEDVKRDSGAVVNGKVTRKEPPKEDAREERREAAGFNFGWFFYTMLAMALTATALALLIPNLLERLTDRGFPRPWAPLLVGFIASIVMPIILLVLALSLVGLPLAILLGLGWLVILILSGHVFAYYVGRLVFRGPRHALLTILAGTGILLLLYFIPVINVFALLAALWIGSGMILMELRQRYPRPEYEIGQPRAAVTARRTSR